MSTSHIINLVDCGSGSFTKVRKQLNRSLGGPEFWDYDKPMFTVDCASTEFEKLQDKLDHIDGIQFLPNHEVIEMVAAAEPEEESERVAEEEPVEEEAPAVEEESAPAAEEKKPAARKLHNMWAVYNKNR